MNVGIGLNNIDEKFKINLEKWVHHVIGLKKNLQWTLI